MVANQATVQAMGPYFDGAAVRIGTEATTDAVHDHLFAPVSMSEATIRAGLAGWQAANFGSVTHNYALVYMLAGNTGVIDWDNPTYRATVAANFGRLATVLADVGKFDGILLDNEPYGYDAPTGPNPYPFNWGDDNGPADAAPGTPAPAGGLPGYTREGARAQVHAFASAIAQAVHDAWPEGKLLQLHSPVLSDALSYTVLDNAGVSVNDVSWANELRAAFFVGMEDVLGPQLFDGGELYELRGGTQHDTWDAWRRDGWRSSGTPYLPAGQVATYAPTLAQGVFDLDLDFSLKTAAELETTVAEALEGRPLAWLYTETHDWWGPATSDARTAVPADFLAALAAVDRSDATAPPAPSPFDADRWLAYRGLVMGQEPVNVRTVEGLADLPELRVSDRPLLLRHGFHAGTDLMGARTITLELEVVAYEEATFTAAVAELLAAFTVGEEAPFTFLVPGLAGGDVGMVLARTRKRATVVDDDYLGWAAAFAVELVATDPRIYAATESVVTTTVPTEGVGRTYPLTYPRDYGAAGTGGLILATNAGNVATPWVARLDGPLNYPRLENLTTDKLLELDMVLQAGEFVTLDSARRSAMFMGSSPVYSSLSPASEWWDLDPGVNEVSFRTIDITDAGTVQLAWRSAWA